MARGGINKRLVKEAREAVLAKGQNPSIDTVRVELGNTGSKTTIHRYLKEIEEAQSARLDDEALLSSTIKDLVARLASNLHAEAKDIVKEANKLHKNQQQEWQEQDKKQKSAITDAENIIAKLKKKLMNVEQQRSIIAEDLQATSIKNQRLEQQIVDLAVLSEEKDKRIQSLEEKHKHARDATEHYRRSVKEQRDQDQRQHEQQVQLLQTEQRQLGQTLSIKLSEITQLNRENARFVTEVSETRKIIPPLNKKIQLLEKQLSTSITKVASLTARQTEQQKFTDRQDKKLTEVKRQLIDAIQVKQELDIEIATLKAELNVKKEIFDKIDIVAQQVS